MTTASEAASRFQELILFFALKSEPDPHFGRTKLRKQLFFVDFLAYRQLGKAVTGQRYQKLPDGPAPRGLLPAVKALVKNGECALATRSYRGYEQTRLMALREPRVAVFSAEQLEIMHQVLEDLRGSPANELRDLSSEFLGWQLVEDGEDIPYQTALISAPGPLTPAEIAYGQQLAVEEGDL